MVTDRNAKAADIVTVDGVVRRYGDVTAVDGVSFTLRRGETVALLGPNGAGKTTTVEMLLGLVTPDAGTVRVFGSTPEQAVASGQVGAMLQDAGLPIGTTVAELVRTVAGLYPNPLPLADVLRLADLDHVAYRHVQRLSGGQQQRVRLALALAGQPDLLVLDEPTASLDVEARQSFWERVRASVSEGRTVVFATHRLEEADAVADRVVVLAAGRVAATGTPEAIKARAAGRATVSLSADGLSPAAVADIPGVDAVESRRDRLLLVTTDPDRTVRALLDQIPHVAGLEVSRPGMDEAFLAITRTDQEDT